MQMKFAIAKQLLHHCLQMYALMFLHHFFTLLPTQKTVPDLKVSIGVPNW